LTVTDPYNSTMATGDFASLAGELLLALPGIGDPRFEQAVIAMVLHQPDGAMGVGIGRTVPGITLHALLKQLDQEVVVTMPAPRGQEPRDLSGPGQMSRRPENQVDGPVDQGAGGFQAGQQRQQQRPRVDASINDPVTKVVGLILGTPEFQRQ